MKAKKIRIILMIVLGLMLGGCYRAQMPNEVYIGVFEPLSGEYASSGGQEFLGIQYAQSIRPTVSIDGVPFHVNLDIQDNGSVDSKALEAANRLVDNKVSAVLGSYGSQVSIIAGPVFAAAGIPAVGCTCTNEAVTQGNDYYFRVTFLDEFQGAAMASFARFHLGFSKAYILSALGRDYGAKLARGFCNAFEAYGGEIVNEVYFPTNTTSFGMYLDEAADLGAELIFAPVSYAFGAHLVQSQGVFENSDLPLFSGDAWDEFSIAAAQKNSGKVIYFSAPFDENDESPEASEFVQGFRAWLKEDENRFAQNGGTDSVSAVSAMGFDAYMTVLDAIENANSAEPEAIRVALEEVHRIGATGEIYFDHNGNAVRNSIAVRTVKNGEFELFTVQTVE